VFIFVIGMYIFVIGVNIFVTGVYRCVIGVYNFDQCILMCDFREYHYEMLNEI
jgi:hypothetical protein